MFGAAGVGTGALQRVDPSADLGGLLPDGGGGQVARLVDDLLEDVLGEVEAGGGAAEIEEGGVVGTRRRDWGGVGTEPDSRPLVRLPYLRHPLPPLPHPYTPVGFLLLTWLPLRHLR